MPIERVKKIELKLNGKTVHEHDVSKNQCDGCRMGIPIGRWGVHYSAEYGAIGCSKELYIDSDKPIDIELS